MDINEMKALIRGNNLWTLRQRAKDVVANNRSTIQAYLRMEFFKPTPEQKAIIAQITDPFELRAYLLANVKMRKRVLTKAHSFVYNWLAWQTIVFNSSLTKNSWFSVTMVDTGGTSRSCDYGAFVYSVGTYGLGGHAPPTITTYGILVGTGTTTPANDDNAMETLIAHGTGAGQLSYGNCMSSPPVENGANIECSFVRPITNGSGSSITLREVGHAVSTADSYWKFLILHDAVNQVIANGEMVLISYLWRTTV